MKAFYPLDCPVLEQIQDEALVYIKTHNLIFNGFWNKINSQDFLKHNRMVFKYCYDLGYVINEVALLIADENTAPPGIHVDEAPLIAKFNFPILNASTAITRWYDVPDVDSLPKTKSPFGADVPKFETNDYPVVAETNMSVPVVFNSSMPHAVIATEDTVYPRIVLACMSNNQPIDLLDETINR